MTVVYAKSFSIPVPTLIHGQRSTFTGPSRIGGMISMSRRAVRGTSRMGRMIRMSRRTVRGLRL